MIFDVSHVLVAFVDLMALTTLIGVAWIQLWGVRLVDATPAVYPDLFLLRLRRLLLFCLLALVVSSTFWFVLRVMEMSGVGLTKVLSVAPLILLKTHYGSMVFIRIGGLVMAWAIWEVSRGRLASRYVAALLLIAGVIIAFSRCASGHLADFGDLSVQQLGDCLHLVAISCLAGSIFTLTGTLSPALLSEKSLPPRFVGELADRFYTLFGPVLAVLVMTGFYSSRFTVGSLEALTTGPYGWLFSVKLLLVLLLMGRYIVPVEHGRDDSLFAPLFLRRLRGDAFLAGAVLLCVATLGHRIPARHQAHLASLALANRLEVSSPQTNGQALQVTLETDAAEIRAGSPVKMTVAIKEQDGRPLQGLAIIHERILHAVIIGKDLNVFAHIHPEDLGPITEEMLTKGRFPLLFSFPRQGEYVVGLDFATADKSYSRTFPLQVSAAEPMTEPVLDFSTQKTFGDYQVTLTPSPEHIVAGQETRLHYRIEKDGAPVTDLAPYLGAPMHLAMVKSDLNSFIHAHGGLPGQEQHDHLHAGTPPEKFGPEIETEVIFPEAGVYKIFSQTQHHNKILLFNFMVNVQPPSTDSLRPLP